jgi:hypothetical protein
MANRFLSIRGRSFSTARMRHRPNAGPHLKRPSFLFNSKLSCVPTSRRGLGGSHRRPRTEGTFAAYVAGCEPVARMMLDLHEVR